MKQSHSIFSPLFPMKKRSGFTLIELMVVMAIIAILATAGLAAYANYIKNARDSARLSIASQVETAVTALMGSNGGVPPTATELLAELDRMNMTTAMNSIIPEEPLYLSALSDTLGHLIGASELFAAFIREPSGGKNICLGYKTNGDIEGGQSCAFRYIVYGDGTYVIGYGVEVEKNMKKNFYKVATATGGGSPQYMQVVGTAQYVGTPSIGETGGPATNNTTAYTVSKVGLTVTNGVATVDNNATASVIDTDKSGALSNETAGGDSSTPATCTPACAVEETCTNGFCKCGSSPACASNQTCVNGTACVDKIMPTCGNGLMIGTYGTVEVNGKCWLDRNLDGGHYQWKRKTAGWVSGWTADPNNPDYGDPCTAAYPTTRMPTQIEWAALISAKSIVNVNTAVSSPTFPLPAQGYMYSVNGISSNGTHGWYWSGTSAGSPNAISIAFGNGVNSNYPDNRQYGFSVRCIQN